MKLQYTTNCALHMMVYLTGEKRIVSSRELEEKTRFPQQCIFNAGRKLKKAGYVNTVAGPFGGYTLGKPPQEISIHAILAVFKDSFSLCCEQMPVINYPTTTLGNFLLWQTKLESDFVEKMSAINLADLVKETDPSFTY